MDWLCLKSSDPSAERLGEVTNAIIIKIQKTLLVAVVQKFKCPVCGAEVEPSLAPEVLRAYEAGEAVFLSLTCPRGHTFSVVLKKPAVEEEALVDCEIRDWDRFSLLPQQQQQVVLESIQSGRVSPSVRALLRRLKEAGIVVCT